MRWFLSILQTAVSEFNTRVHITLNYFSLTASKRERERARTIWATFLFHHAEWWLRCKMIFPPHSLARSHSKLNSAKHTHQRWRRALAFFSPAGGFALWMSTHAAHQRKRLRCLFFCSYPVNNSLQSGFEMQKQQIWPLCFDEFWLQIVEFEFNFNVKSTCVEMQPKKSIRSSRLNRHWCSIFRSL
jgi:hypothetical protein